MSFGNFLLILLIYVPLILLWVFALTDLSHRVDISGLAKGFWAVAIVLLPVIGMLIYFITRPHSDDAYRKPPTVTDVPAVAPSTNLNDKQVTELEKIADLKEAGAITDEEFATMKSRILG